MKMKPKSEAPTPGGRTLYVPVEVDSFLDQLEELDAASEIEVRAVRMTPEAARILLKSNRGNRSINNTRIDTYARTMRAGKWLLNGEAILIDKEGYLLDGQNRLHACIKANKSFDVFVIANLDRSVMGTLDLARPRTISNHFEIMGRKNATLLASTVRWYWKLLAGPSHIKGPMGPTILEAEELEAKNPFLAQAIQRVHTKNAKDVLRSESKLGAFYAVVAQRAPTQADEFVRKLINGTGLMPGDPVLLLRNRFLSLRREAGRSWTRYEKQDWFDMLLLIITWNHFIKSNVLKKLQVTKNFAIPRILMGPDWSAADQTEIARDDDFVDEAEAA